MPGTAARLQRIVRETFGDDTIVVDGSTTAGDIVGWDSLGFINFMFAVEEEFGIRLPDKQLTGFTNLGELSRYLEARQLGGSR